MHQVTPKKALGQHFLIDDGIAQQGEKGPVMEQGAVLTQRKTGERADTGTLVEGSNTQHDHRKIQKQKHQDREDTGKTFHSGIISSPRSSLLEKWFMTPTQTNTMTMRIRLSAAPRLGL